MKLLAEPETLRLIGAQMVGQEGIKERADFLAMAVKTGITIEDLAYMENVYSPPIGALNEPIALAAQNLLANLTTMRFARWLRTNSEHYLLMAAQRDVAARYGRPCPRPRRASRAGSSSPCSRRSTGACPGASDRSSSTRCRAATARRGRRVRASRSARPCSPPTSP